ncbi:uncharacterized protein LOC123723341 [Papilio machaon]|uniref:uncharacterized protein LOC123723341 n=1 Tax=Papilio machaon TaxID=76193 RepID=UPI001E663F69|nr:uncharacterized protein LOC123723341 [Papilio machaon]
MALYGAPMWADALNAPNRALLRRPQRIIAARACRAYRTVGHAAACVLAGTPPWEIEAGVLSEAYWARATQRARGEAPAPEELSRAREARRKTTVELWASGLAHAQYAHHRGHTPTAPGVVWEEPRLPYLPTDTGVKNNKKEV